MYYLAESSYQRQIYCCYKGLAIVSNLCYKAGMNLCLHVFIPKCWPYHLNVATKTETNVFPISHCPALVSCQKWQKVWFSAAVTNQI